MGLGKVAPAPVRATPLKLPEPPLLLLQAAPTTATTRPAATSRSMRLVLVMIPPSFRRGRRYGPQVSRRGREGERNMNNQTDGDGRPVPAPTTSSRNCARRTR